jgi:hypothetical protein
LPTQTRAAKCVRAMFTQLSRNPIQFFIDWDRYL